MIQIFEKCLNSLIFFIIFTLIYSKHYDDCFEPCKQYPCIKNLCYIVVNSVTFAIFFKVFLAPYLQIVPQQIIQTILSQQLDFFYILLQFCFKCGFCIPSNHSYFFHSSSDFIPISKNMYCTLCSASGKSSFTIIFSA